MGTLTRFNRLSMVLLSIVLVFIITSDVLTKNYVDETFKWHCEKNDEKYGLFCTISQKKDAEASKTEEEEEEEEEGEGEGKPGSGAGQEGNLGDDQEREGIVRVRVRDGKFRRKRVVPEGKGSGMRRLLSDGDNKVDKKVDDEAKCVKKMVNPFYWLIGSIS